MSKRSTETYQEAIKALVSQKGKPQFEKYIGRKNFTPQEKAAIARAMKWKGKIKRSNAQYQEIVKEYKAYVPGFKKYARRKTFKGGQRAYISKMFNTLRYAPNLFPVTKKIAKEHKDLLFAPGVRAIPLDNVAKHAKPVFTKRRDIVLVSNGRTWIYWKLSKVKPRDMQKAGEKVFNDLQNTFDIEKLLILAKKAFEHVETKRVYLWTHHGRVGERFATLGEFELWLRRWYSTYEDTEKWVNGIAILIGEVGEKVALESWETETLEEKEERINRRREFRKKMRQRRG